MGIKNHSLAFAVSILLTCQLMPVSSFANAELDKLYEQINKCYAGGRLEAARPLYERALKIIEASGDQKALAEAKANFGALVRRIEKTRSPSAVPSTKILNLAAATNSAAKEECAKYVLEVSRKANEVWLKEAGSFVAPVMVQFLINAQGAISKLELAPGCGAGKFEQFEAFSAVMKAAPFAPLPKPALPQLSVRITLKQDRGSIGLVFQVRDNNVVVTHVRAGSPAEKAGICAGDLILSVNGKEIPGIPSLDEVSILMRGKTGTPIALQIQHENNVRNLTLTRVESNALNQNVLGSGSKTNREAATAPPMVRISSGDRALAKKLQAQARALADSGDLKKSIVLFDQATQLYPSDVEICCDRGVVNRDLKRWDEAIADFERARQLRPDALLLDLEVASCYAESGQRDKALTMLWELKKTRSASDSDRLDGALVALADAKAITSLSMLGHADPLQLLKAKRYLIKTGNTREVGTIERLMRETKGGAKEEKALARYYMAESDYKNATECFERLYASDRMDPDNLYGLIHCYEEVGNLERCHECMDEFSKRFANDFRASSVRDMAEYYKEDFKNIREREKNETAKQDEAHFEKRQMPLKVYVPDLVMQSMSWAKKPDLLIDYSKIVNNALEEWKRATGGAVSFEVVRDVNEALIEVDWVGDMSKMKHSFAAGTAGFVNGPGRRRTMVVSLLVVDDKHIIDAEAFYKTALHEFGHAIGLSHSSQPRDMMYFGGVRVTNPSLTDNDAKRAIELYRD